MSRQYSPSLRISPSLATKMAAIFHVATAGLLTFICVSENTFERKVAYNFLDRVADELVAGGQCVMGTY